MFKKMATSVGKGDMGILRKISPLSKSRKGMNQKHTQKVVKLDLGTKVPISSNSNPIVPIIVEVISLNGPHRKMGHFFSH